MTDRSYIPLICMILCVCLSGCNKNYQQAAKADTMEQKYERARQLYNNGDCMKAIPMFEELITYYKGSRNLEDAYFSYAHCHYIERQYIVASYHFERFNQLYPRSGKREESSFMIAKCSHEQSPKFSLDQTPTLEAIDAYRRFAEQFPGSPRIAEVNRAIDDLRLKLHQKAFDNAMLYYKLRDFQAAAVSFRTLVEDYPESADVERSWFYIVMANKLFADNSYTSRKKERYEATITAYEEFRERYPGSGYLAELERLHDNVTEILEEIATTSQNN